MFQILQSALFRDLPTEHIEQFFGVIERAEYEPGQSVVEQGEPGDYFYMIAQGECEVMRNVNGLAFPIATLEPGESFGEEALISGMPRNATVRTKTEAVLMRLTKANFDALLQIPTVKSVKAAEAAPLIQQGACTILDVRMESEHGARSIRNSINMPLYRVRSEFESLDPEKPVITFCDCGERSKVAAFLLCQRGIDARFLEGGLAALGGAG
ncbi:MAG: cyclic nucleotide-binding domain-containing protein [Pseudomonadota bacterium]